MADFLIKLLICPPKQNSAKFKNILSGALFKLQIIDFQGVRSNYLSHPDFQERKL